MIVYTATTKDITVKTKTVILNNDQIKNLPSTTISIFDQVAENESIMLLGGTIKIDASAGAYSNFDAAGVTALQIRGIAQLPYANFRSALVDNIPLEFRLFPSESYYVSSDLEVTSGNAQTGQQRAGYIVGYVDAYIDNFDPSYNTNLGNFTGGHADNYIKITLVYSIID